MKLGLVKIICFLFLVFFLPVISHAAPTSTPIVEPARYFTCDACGFCPIIVNGESPSCTVDPVNGPVPGNWKACVRCLYPSLFPTSVLPNPGACSTLKVVPNTKLPPTPYLGRQYTLLGCLTSQGGFQNNTGSGASSFVQALFDLLVFRITGGIAFLYLLYGSFLVLTSQAEPERLNYGKRVIVGAVVGLIFALSSIFIVNLIGSGILKIPGFTGQVPTPTP